MYARHTGGTMILRIEDTDADRSRPELIQAIYDSLTWLGIDWDEEYRQSDRFDQYVAAATDFVERDLAYYCDCSQDAVKERAEARGAGASGYDGFCRDRDVSPGEGVVIRFRTPDSGSTSWEDAIRGTVEFDNSLLEDFIIVRSSGVPMFHLANAYDDLDMKITHVVRGEDLVNTTPRVLLLREAMGSTDHPIYAHLPLIVNEQRKKLSKRRDDVSVGDYTARGYLPDAMRNYLLTLGWGPKDEIEIRPIGEFIEAFELRDINKAPAFFDVKKLDAFNAEYIRALSVEEFVAQATPYLGDVDPALFAKMAPFVQDRVKRLDEVAPFVDWIKGPAGEPTEKEWKKATRQEGTANALRLIAERLADCEWTPAAIEAVIFGVGGELDIKTQLPARVAITGRGSGIPLFEPMAEMERSVVIERINTALAKLS